MSQRWRKQVTDPTMSENEESIEIRTPDIKCYQSDQLDWPDDAMVLKVASDVRWVKIDANLPKSINTLVLYRSWKKSSRRSAWNCRLLSCCRK